MASSPITILEETQISPPSSSPPLTTSLPLTFFDIPWLLFPQSQPLFFYTYSNSSSTSHFFTSTILPKLKTSLSSALLQFTPFAGKINASTSELVYSDGDSVKITVAEAVALDFDHLCSDLPKETHVLRELVPTCSESDCLAVQFTCFPFAGGFSVGMAYPRVTCDQRTFNHFLKAWADSCTGPRPRPSTGIEVLADFLKLGPTGIGPSFKESARPSYDRSCIMGRGVIQPIVLSQLRTEKGRRVRATFVMGPKDIENGRNWIEAQCRRKKSPRPVLLSDYIVACGFLWACLAKAQYTPAHKRGPVYFGFIAGGLSRLPFRVPGSYFGNCVAFGRAEVATAQELVGEGGVEVAAAAIAEAVKRLDGDVLGGVERWIGEWEEVIGSDMSVNVVGSPKVDLYETDFGWGRPRKIEEVGIDEVGGVSLCESRDLKGGIEIGVALSKAKLDGFSKVFWKGIREFELNAMMG